MEAVTMDKLLLKVLETALQPVIALLTSIDAKLGNGAPGFVPAAAPTPAENVVPVKPVVATPVAEVPKEAIPVVTREELGKALVAVAKIDMDKAKAILSQFKAAQLADVAAADYPALAKDIADQQAEFVKATAAKDLLG
jgi:hypothetical protein